MNEDVPKLMIEANAIAEEAQKNFGNLTAEQLNWRPKGESWSVAQCFAHLIAINSDYFPLIKKIAHGQYKPSLKERIPLLPRLFGSLTLRAVQPDSQRKFKADPKFQPSSGTEPDIIAKFAAHQRDVVEHIKMTRNLNLNRIIITSPVVSFATYSLLDAYKIVVAHERRHMAQAKRVTETEGFPKGRVRSSAAS